MKVLFRVKINPDLVREDCQKDGYLAGYGKIMEYTRGEAIKKARMFDGKIERAPVKIVKKKTFKLWICIEQDSEFTDGTDEYKDMEDIDETVSLGEFDTLEEAIIEMNKLANTSK